MPLTLRELLWAAEARLYGQWDATAALMALIANCHRDPKKRAFTPWDFFHRPGQKKPGTANQLTVDVLHALKPAFTKGR